MRIRWVVLVGVASVLIVLLTATLVSANATNMTAQSVTRLLHRCENNYDDEELADMQSNGEDGYEPDDCPLLAHVLTGPMLLNFCQPGDEDWVKFKAQPNVLYQIRAESPSNYPTEPHMELYVDNVLTSQNDHYFNNNAEIWWWNSSTDRTVYVRMTELGGRHDCGNNSYTLTLHAFTDNPYPSAPATPILIPTPTLVPTDTVTPTTTPTPGG